MNERSKRTIIALVSALGLGAGGLALGVVLLTITAVVLIVGLGVQIGGVEALVLSLFFVQGVGCIGVALAYIRLQSDLRPKIRSLLGIDSAESGLEINGRIPTLRDVGVIAGGYVLAFVGALLGALIVSQVPVDTGRNQVADIAINNPGIILYLIPVMLFVVGPGEELLFRGIVQGRLREVFPPATAIGVASVFFAFIHYFALTGGTMTGNLVAVSLLLPAALVLGATYEYTNNIVVPAVIHGVYNSTIVLIMYVSVVYSDQLSEGVANSTAVL